MTTPGLNRRQTLTGAAAAVGAVPLLAACGGGGSNSTATDPPPAGKTLGPTTDVPVGGGKIFADDRIVVTQPTAGDFKAFSAVCTHAGCVVANLNGGTINCICHGSKFSEKDGSVINGPATSPLAPVTVTVTGGNITTA